MIYLLHERGEGELGVAGQPSRPATPQPPGFEKKDEDPCLADHQRQPYQVIRIYGKRIEQLSPVARDQLQPVVVALALLDRIDELVARPESSGPGALPGSG